VKIKATAFDAAADGLFDKIRKGGVYYMSCARVNTAKKFLNLANDNKISLEKASKAV